MKIVLLVAGALGCHYAALARENADLQCAHAAEGLH